MKIYRFSFFAAVFLLSSCGHTGHTNSELVLCQPVETMLPRISEACEASLNDASAYHTRLNNALYSRKVLPDDLRLIFTFREGPIVESICILSNAQGSIDSKTERATRRMSKMPPPTNLSCLSNHHAEIRFTTEYADEKTRELLEEYMRR